MSDQVSIDAPAIDPNALYARKEAARIIKTSERSVDRDIERGDLEVTRFGNLVRITGLALMKRFGLV